MSPFDVRLPIIAAAAKVRPPHVFHVFHAIKEMGAKFHVEACAQFMSLEAQHVEAILSSLQEHDCMPTKAKRGESSRGSRLADDWTIPDDWVDWACNERRWQPYDCREEAEIFALYWQTKTGAQATKMDWKRTWMKWVKSSRRPNGDYVPKTAAPVQSPEERAEWLRKSIKLYVNMGRESETERWRKELESIEGNVLPF